MRSSYPWQAVLESADEQLVRIVGEQAARGVSAPLPDGLHPALVEGLAATGIDELWSHQADALEASRGRSTKHSEI